MFNKSVALERKTNGKETRKNLYNNSFNNSLIVCKSWSELGNGGGVGSQGHFILESTNSHLAFQKLNL
jgi:hypothetical protein